MSIINWFIQLCKNSRFTNVFAVSFCMIAVLQAATSYLYIKEFLYILIYLTGTFLCFSLIDNTFRKKPHKLVGLTVVFIICQIPILEVMQYYCLFDLFDLALFALALIELVYLPYCIWKCIALLWKQD